MNREQCEGCIHFERGETPDGADSPDEDECGYMRYNLDDMDDEDCPGKEEG